MIKLEKKTKNNITSMGNHAQTIQMFRKQQQEEHEDKETDL